MSLCKSRLMTSLVMVTDLSESIKSYKSWTISQGLLKRLPYESNGWEWSPVLGCSCIFAGSICNCSPVCDGCTKQWGKRKQNSCMWVCGVCFFHQRSLRAGFRCGGEGWMPVGFPEVTQGIMNFQRREEMLGQPLFSKQNKTEQCF